MKLKSLPSNETTNQTCITLILKKQSNVTLIICILLALILGAHVLIVINIWAEWSVVWFLAEAWNFFPLSRTFRLVPDPIQLSLHLLLGVLCVRLKWPVHQVATYLHLVVRLTAGEAVLLFPHLFSCCQQNNFALLFYIVMVERTGCADIDISSL